jgi:teichuronic acid biosynthesis glycosyltransferase TuaH
VSKAHISGRDFIVFGLQPWDFEMGSNSKNIATELSRHNRVLYVNRPIERSTLYKFKDDHKIQNRLKSLKYGFKVLENEADNLWVFNPRVILESINWLPPSKVYHSISKINAKRLAKQIHWAIAQLQLKDPILFIDNDFLKAYYLNDYLKADLQVYYIRDYLLSQPYFEKHGKKMEPGFMGKANVVVANSLYLANYSKQYNPLSYDIGQGCDLEGYTKDNHTLPEDLINIKGPIIGYCGALLNTRLDIKLLEEMAKQKQEWNFILVGPEDTAFKTSSLHNLRNVHFLGSKPVEQLPSYVHYFDVCINPQVLNQMTIGNYPRKIDEYLAAGKQIVATKTQAMEMFKEYCYLASNVEEYIKGISDSLFQKQDPKDIQRKREFALSHTWEASVSGLYKSINEYYKCKAYETK